MTDTPVLGFVGLGVMGEAMCRNLAKKSGRPVIAFDLKPEPLQRLAGDGVEIASSLADLAGRADIVFLSLPGEPEVRKVVQGADGVLAHLGAGKTLVDCSTTPVTLAQELEKDCAANGVAFADAPVARTAQAARDGTLAIMVGAAPELFAKIQPFLACMGTEIAHCGKPGAGQVVKLMNNMVVVRTVHAIAEALAAARASGLVDGEVLFDVMSKGSADSFVLRNHGQKFMVKGNHPEKSFPVGYILKDLTYAMQFGESAGVPMKGAEATKELLERASGMGFGERYYTVVIEAIQKQS